MFRKANKIQTTLPINISVNHKWIFLKREFYKMPELKLRKLNNVFLTHYGILLKNCFPVKKSLPNAWGFRKPNAGFIFKFWRKGVEVFLVSKKGKSLKSISLSKEKTYLQAFTPWFGYFSWITESLPRILSCIDQHSSLHLILPEAYSKKKFVIDSLKMFPNLKHEIIPEGVYKQMS